MKQNKLSIVIPVYNRWNFTSACLKDLAYLDTDMHEIIIVDNASTDGTVEGMNHWLKRMPNLVYIRNTENTGFGAACNRGFASAKYDNVMFLNNDIKVYANLPIWTDVYLNALQETPGVIMSPTGGYVDPKRDFQFCYETEGDKKFNYLSGWMLVASKETFNKLIEEGNDGPFNSKLYFAYFEDTHLSFRAAEMGMKLSLVPNNSVSHFGKITSKQINTAKLYSQSKKVFLEVWKKK
jgi:GT2 family glycosyltransferase